MRITNNMMINNMMSSISRNLEKMSKKQDELATGKSISSPSDDPIGASKILKYNTDLSELDQFTRNNNDAIAWLETTETAISDINKVLQRARELSVSAANGTNTKGETEKIRSEILELKKIIVADGNYSFAGRYVFSGYQTDKPLLNADGTFNIDVTDLEVNNLPTSRYDIGVGEDVEVNTHGLKIFGPTLIPDGAMRSFTHATGDLNLDTINSQNINPPTVPGTAGVAATRATAVCTFADLNRNFAGMTIQVGAVTATLPSPTPNTLNNPTQAQLTSAIRTAITAAGAKADVYFESPGKMVIKASDYGNLNPGATNDIAISAVTGMTTTVTDGTNTTETSFSGASAVTGPFADYVGKQYVVTVNGNPQKITLGAPITDATTLAASFQNAINSKFPVTPPALTPISVTESGGVLTFTTQGTEDGKVPGFEIRAVTAKTNTLITDFDNFITALGADDKVGIQAFLASIDTHINDAVSAQADIGGRSNRLDLVSNRIAENSIIYTRLLSNVQDADMSEVIMQLKNSENVYKSSLSAGARIIQPSLVDFLR